MATFFMFGDYTMEALKKISAQRSEKAVALIEAHGGTLKEGYALLGKHDLVVIVELPGVEAAMKVSVALSKMLGIAFTTAPAVDMATFDQLMEDV